MKENAILCIVGLTVGVLAVPSRSLAGDEQVSRPPALVEEPAAVSAPGAGQEDAAIDDGKVKNTTGEKATLKSLEYLDRPALLKYGFTFGVGAVGIQGFGKKADQTDMGVTAMPYVAIIPSYWFLGDVTRDYCATQSIRLSRKEARAAADQKARELATERWTNASTATRNDDANKSCKEDTEGVDCVKNMTGWKIGLDGACAVNGTWFALFGGFPIGYQGRFAGGGRKPLEVTTRGAFGIAILPHPYAGLFFGLSRIAVARDDDFVRGWAYVTGVGGNVEIFSSLLNL